MPTPSCPPEIKEMMTTPVFWEAFLGFDGHGEPSYAPGRTLYCFRESHGLSQTGIEVMRKADESVSDPDWDMFFSGDDVRVEDFSLYDRFTPGGVASPGISLQPASINTIVGPPFDNANPWLVCVVT